MLVSNILFLIGVALVPAVFIPRGKRFRAILDVALAERRMTTELRSALNDPIVGAAHIYEMMMLVVIVALMTLKPF